MKRVFILTSNTQLKKGTFNLNGLAIFKWWTIMIKTLQ